MRYLCKLNTKDWQLPTKYEISDMKIETKQTLQTEAKLGN